MIEAVDRPEKIPEVAQKLADHLSAAITSGAGSIICQSSMMVL